MTEFELPAFLKRNKDNTFKQKSKKRTPALIHKGNGAQVTVDIYAALSAQAKAWVQGEVSRGRFREAWLGDSSVVKFVEEQATRAVSDNKMTDEVKETLRSKKRQGSTPRPSREGLVGIAVIAGELKIDAREARVALRSLKITKPAVGWAFDTDTAKTIKERIATWLASQSSTTKSKPAQSKKSSSKTKLSPSVSVKAVAGSSKTIKKEKSTKRSSKSGSRPIRGIKR